MRKMTQRIAVILAAALLMAIPASAQVAVVADAGEDLLDLECSTTDGTTATLNGTLSTVDGLPAASDPNTTFLWEALDVVFDDETSPTPNGTFPVGPTTVTLTVTHTEPPADPPAVPPAEPVVTSATDTVEVSIGDTSPPTIAAVSDPLVLWPPNHKLHQVDVDLVVMDSCDPDPIVELTSLESNEPDNGNGDGNTVDDIQEAEIGTDDRTFLLRAERMGGGSGRIYTPTYNATDASGNSTDGMIQILVPHDQGDLKAAKAEAKAVQKMAKAEAKAMEKMAKAQAKADAKLEKQLAKELAKQAKQAAKAAKKNAKKGN